MIGFIGRLQICADQQRGFTAPIAYIVMSGRRPLIKGYFAALRLIVGCGHVFGLLMRVMAPVGPDVVR
jgi:hypothetical protein